MSNQNNTYQENKLKKNWRTHLVFIASFIVAIVTFLNEFKTFIDSLREYIEIKIYTEDLRPRSKDEILIIIIPFVENWNDFRTNTRHVEIIEELKSLGQALKKEDSLNLRLVNLKEFKEEIDYKKLVAISDLPKESGFPKEIEEAERIRSKYDATFIIWGASTSNNTIIKTWGKEKEEIQNIAINDFDKIDIDRRYSKRSYDHFETKLLPGQVKTTVLHFLAKITHQDKPALAISLITKAIQSANALSNTSKSELALIYQDAGIYHIQTISSSNTVHLTATQYFSLSINTDPSLISSYLYRSFSNFKLKKYDAAISDITAYLSSSDSKNNNIDLKFAKYLQGRSYLLKTEKDASLELKNREKAISLFEEVLALDPEDKFWLQNKFVYHAIGLARFEDERYDEAITAYTNSLNLARGESKIYQNAYFHRAEAHYQKGVTEKAKEKDPSKSFEEAVKDFSVVIDDFKSKPDIPTPSRAYYLRGETFLAMKKYKDAINDYDEMLLMKDSFDKKKRWGYYHRGQANFELGNYDKAIEDFIKSIQEDENPEDKYPWQNYFLTRAYLSLKPSDNEKAKENYIEFCKKANIYFSKNTLGLKAKNDIENLSKSIERVSGKEWMKIFSDIPPCKS